MCYVALNKTNSQDKFEEQVQEPRLTVKLQRSQCRPGIENWPGQQNGEVRNRPVYIWKLDIYQSRRYESGGEERVRNSAGTNVHPYGGQRRLESYLMSYIKINPTWIINLKFISNQRNSNLN